MTANVKTARTAGLIFRGLWLYPLGYLVFKSGFLPKILGILLMLGCFGYLIDFVGNFLFASYRQTVISEFITIPAGIGEIRICFWLLIVGVRKNTAHTSAQELVHGN